MIRKTMKRLDIWLEKWACLLMCLALIGGPIASVCLVKTGHHRFAIAMCLVTVLFLTVMDIRYIQPEDSIGPP